MKLLLDTHIFVWINLNPSRLSRRASKVIADSRNELWISPVTTWEILFLHRKGRLTL
jgi:PIN domain nuclease of toxin-antitoxin system